MSNEDRTAFTSLPPEWEQPYIDRAVSLAVVTEVDPGVWVAEVPGLNGAWSDGDSAAAALAELPSVIAGWLEVGRRFKHMIPVLPAAPSPTPGAPQRA